MNSTSNSTGSFSSGHIVKQKEEVLVFTRFDRSHCTVQRWSSDQEEFDFQHEFNLISLLVSPVGVNFICVWAVIIFKSSSNHLQIGFCHLTVTNVKLECSSSDRKGHGSVVRQEKKKKICIQCHPFMFLWFDLIWFDLATLITSYFNHSE